MCRLYLFPVRRRQIFPLTFVIRCVYLPVIQPGFVFLGDADRVSCIGLISHHLRSHVAS